MARPPRDPKAPLFGLALVVRGLLQGSVVLAAALAVFLAGVGGRHGEDAARGMAFVTLVLGNLVLVMANRSLGSSGFRAAPRPNKALGFVVLVTLLALVLTIEVPWLRDLFGFARLGAGQIAVSIGAAVAGMAIIESMGAAARWFRRRDEARLL